MASQQLLAALRTDPYSFVHRAFRAIHDGQKLRDDYVRYLCHELAKLSSGESRRVICNLPPRHLKTFIACCLISWILGRNPSAKVMVVSYGEELAKMITRQIREILRMEWYKEVFPATRLARDQTSVTNFATTKNGTVRAFSIEGGITGFGADYIIVDDPLEIQDAENLLQIDRVNALFESKVRTRLNDPETGCILIIAHRLNEDDLSGYLLKEKGWDHLVLPFMAERKMTFTFGDERWVRRKGDLLRESYRKDLDRIVAQSNYRALYQQDPGATSLPRITPEHFPFYQPSDIPSTLRVLSIDPGEQQRESNSYSVAQIWQLVEGRYYLEELRRVRVRYDELRSICKGLMRHYRPSAILIEETGIGLALLSDLKFQNWQEVVPVRPRQSKTDRLRKHASVIRCKKLLLVSNAPWRNEYIEEFVSFPNGRFTDQVDATTQFLEYMASNPMLQTPPSRATISVASGSQFNAPSRLSGFAKDPAGRGLIQLGSASYLRRYRW